MHEAHDNYVNAYKEARDHLSEIAKQANLYDMAHSWIASFLELSVILEAEDFQISNIMIPQKEKRNIHLPSFLQQNISTTGRLLNHDKISVLGAEDTLTHKIYVKISAYDEDYIKDFVKDKTDAVYRYIQKDTTNDSYFDSFRYSSFVMLVCKNGIFEATLYLPKQIVSPMIEAVNNRKVDSFTFSLMLYDMFVEEKSSHRTHQREFFLIRSDENKVAFSNGFVSDLGFVENKLEKYEAEDKSEEAEVNENKFAEIAQKLLIELRRISSHTSVAVMFLLLIFIMSFF